MSQDYVHIHGLSQEKVCADWIIFLPDFIGRFVWQGSCYIALRRPILKQNYFHVCVCGGGGG